MQCWVVDLIYQMIVSNSQWSLFSRNWRPAQLYCDGVIIVVKDKQNMIIIAATISYDHQEQWLIWLMRVRSVTCCHLTPLLLNNILLFIIKLKMIASVVNWPTLWKIIYEWIFDSPCTFYCQQLWCGVFHSVDPTLIKTSCQ